MKQHKLPVRVFICLLLSAFAINSQSQSKFSYRPEYPKPGDEITFTYEVTEIQAGNSRSLVASFILGRTTGTSNRDEILLERNGNIYTGRLKTDTMDCFIGLGFHVDDKFVKNEDFHIMLYNMDKPVKRANYWLSGYYQFEASRMGGNIDLDKAKTAMEDEFRLYPDTWSDYFSDYVKILRKVGKTDSASVLIQKEIEAIIRGGLKTENDYSSLEGLYNLAKLSAQAAFMNGLKREKFPGIKWELADMWQRFWNEKGINEKEQILTGFIEKVNKDENWRKYKDKLSSFYLEMAYACIENKLWTRAASHIEKVVIKDTIELVNIYSDMVTAILKQKATEEFPYAEKLSGFSIRYARSQLNNPLGTKPDWLTSRHWKAERAFQCANASDLYAQVLYAMGQYKKSYLFAKEAVLLKSEATNYPLGKIHTNYARIAEKVIPTGKLKTELESFVINHTASDEIKRILEKIFIKEKKNSTGFEEYYTALYDRNYSSAVDRYRKKRLDEAASDFTLYNMDGVKVSLNELKGKVVILYYWYTTCGPCLGSLPVMQKLVNKFKMDKDVIFLFINSSERRFPVKETVQKFLQENKYSLNVLLDESGQVAAQFNVASYPTKIIIDRAGKISFRMVGYDGLQDKMLEEMSAMIEIAK